MQIFHLIVRKIRSLFDPLLQMFDPNVSFFQAIMHLVFHPFILPLLPFNNSVLFFQLPLEVLTVVFKTLNYTWVPLLNVLYVSCMYFSDPFFQVIDLKLILPLHDVQFFSQHVDLTLQLFSIALVLLSLFG
jgi:hypothetical protein